MNLPAAGYISNANRTTAEEKVAFEDQRNFIAALLGGSPEGALTISAGAITPGSEDSGRAKPTYAVDTEGLAATDDLTTIAITNCHSGMFLLIRCANDARAVVIKHGAGGGGELSMANGLDYTLRSVRQWVLFQLRGTQWLEMDRGPAIVGGRWEVQGLVGGNNAGTPNTQFDLAADVVTLRSPADQSTVTRTSTGTLTNNLSTAGPAANGRDQAGAFSANSWVHFYFIWNGTTLSTVSSAVAPPTGPTLPTGYTHWAYATAVRFSGSSALLAVDARGNTVYYRAPQLVQGSISATAPFSCSAASFAPPNALAYEIEEAGWTLTADGAGAMSADLEVHVVSGTVYRYLVRPSLLGLAASGAGRTQTGHSVWVPNKSQTFFVKWTITIGTLQSAAVTLSAYKVPNGDSG